MLTGDGSPYWGLADSLRVMGHDVRCRECVEDWFFAPARNKVTAEDVLWADAVIAYSFGVASWKMLTHHLEPFPKDYEAAIFIAGCPDAMHLQFGGNIWHLAPWVKRGWCFQVDALPQSYPLLSTTDAAVNTHIGSGVSGRWTNYNCNALVSGLDPVSKHTSIQNHPSVLAEIVRIIQTTLTSPVAVPSPLAPATDGQAARAIMGGEG